MSEASSAPTAKSISILGIIALVLGVVALAFAIAVPCLGWLGLPLSILGAILGLIGIIVSAAGGKQGIILPLLGTLVSVAAIVVPLLWLGAAANAALEGIKKVQEEAMKQADKAPKVTVSELVKALKDDKKKSDYVGKMVKLKGKIADIKAEEWMSLTANLKGEGTDSIPVKFFGTQQTNLKKVSSGSEVEVFGVVNGTTPELDNGWLP